MGRRLILLVAIAMAAGFGISPEPSRSQEASPPAGKPPRSLPIPKPPASAPKAPEPDQQPPPPPGGPPAEGAEPPTFPAEIPLDASDPMPVEAQEPVKPLPVPDKLPQPLPIPPEGPTAAAPLDPNVERVDDSTKGAAVPPDGAQPNTAQEPPGGVPPSASAGAVKGSELFVIPPDHAPIGAQSVSLVVDVQSPPVLNLNQPATLKIIVKNTGNSDALGVVVREELPDGLVYISSRPETHPDGPRLFWNLNTIPAGTEQTILLKVRATAVRPFDHAATVTMMAAGKSRTIVKQPLLRVELAATAKQVLKGQPVQYKIAVWNPGTGTARQVRVEAKLSPGLRHESGGPDDQNLFEQTIDRIDAGQRINLETLVLDTIQGDEQSCTVTATSPDVSPGSAEASASVPVKVVEPKLELTLSGPSTRYTDTVANYVLTVKNPGSAPARNVVVVANLPINGRLFAQPAGADRFDVATRKLRWRLPQLDEGKDATFSYQVRMGGVEFYHATAEAQATGIAPVKGECRTNVTGMADVKFDITELSRVVDVGEEITFRIDVKNRGSKEATNLLISAELSDNVEFVQWAAATDEALEAKKDKTKNVLVVNEIPRLGKGSSLPMIIRVKALKEGLATCRISLTHADLVDTKLEGTAATRITAPRTP